MTSPPRSGVASHYKRASPAWEAASDTHLDNGVSKTEPVLNWQAITGANLLRIDHPFCVDKEATFGEAFDCPVI